MNVSWLIYLHNNKLFAWIRNAFYPLLYFFSLFTLCLCFAASLLGDIWVLNFIFCLNNKNKIKRKVPECPTAIVYKKVMLSHNYTFVFLNQFGFYLKAWASFTRFKEEMIGVKRQNLVSGKRQFYVVKISLLIIFFLFYNLMLYQIVRIWSLNWSL